MSTRPIPLPDLRSDPGTAYFGNEFGGVTATLANQVIELLQDAGLWSWVGQSKEAVGAIIQAFAQGQHGFMPGDTRFAPETLGRILYHFTYTSDPNQARAVVARDGIVNPNAFAEINAVTGNIQGGFTITQNRFGPPDASEINFTLGEGGGVIEPPTRDFLSHARLLYPWMPDELLQVWADGYAEYGNSDLAMAEVRRDSRYDQYFPGNRRPDGTVRNDESTYVSTFEGYNRVLIESGLNPSLFDDNLVALYTGETSVAEFQQRVSTVRTQIFDNIDEVRSVFSEFYNVGDLSDEAFLASALDPSIGNDILNRRIDIAQVAATGRQAGFMIGQDTARRLVDRGFGQLSAAERIFDPARQLLPGLNRSAQRFDSGDRTFGIGEFTEAAGFADPFQTRRIRRLQGQESALFTRNSVRNEDGLLTGLRER